MRWPAWLSHPGMYDLAGKYPKLGKGPNPFIDPEGYKREIEEQVFYNRLAEQKRPPGNKNIRQSRSRHALREVDVSNNQDDHRGVPQRSSSQSFNVADFGEASGRQTINLTHELSF